MDDRHGPEFILLLECRKTEKGPAWRLAPVQFTNRPLALDHDGREVWRIAAHKEPPEQSELLYTTGFVRTFTIPEVSASSKASESK